MKFVRALIFALCLTPMCVMPVAHAAQQVINVGATPGDGAGDKGNVAFGKVNANFAELYAGLGIILTVPNGAILGNNSGSTAAPGILTGLTADTSGNLTGKRALFQGPMSFSTTTTPNVLSVTNVSGTATTGAVAAYNQFNINSDSLNTTGVGGPGGAYGMYVGQVINNALMTGNRTVVDGLVFITAPSGNPIGTNKFYVGTAGQCNSSANDNGIAGAGNSVGNCFGFFGSARLQSGATFWNSVVGLELDIGINSGASAAYETGLQIVHWATAAVKGSAESTGLSFSDQIGASSAWDRLIGIGSTHGIFPVNGGTIMGAVPTALGGSAYSVAHGIDFVNNGGVTCTVDCFASNGYSVDGSGNVSGVKYTSTVSTGTAPLTVASTTNVPNLNASSLNGATFAAPGAIGGTTPGAGTFTSVTIPAAGNQIPVVAWNWGVPFGIPPSGSFPNLGASHTAIYVIGQNPASSATLSVSATSGSVTATFSAATLLGTASDVGRVISISDTTIKICTVTAQSSTTVATCTLGATLSGTGPFANASVWITGTPSTGTATYSTPLSIAFPNAYFYFPANAINGANTAGSYYAQCTSIAVCQIFGGINGGTNPLIATTTFPGLQASPTNFSITGNGNFTQTTGGVLLFAMPIAANSLGADGALKIETFGVMVNNANTKSIQFRLGGTGIGQVATTSVAWQGYTRTVRNTGATNSQVVFPNGAGATTDMATSTSVPVYLALDTTTSLNLQPIFSLTTSALDWVFDLGGTITTNYAP